MVAAEPAPPARAPQRTETAGLRVRLIGKSNGVGLTRDLELLAEALRAAGCAVSLQSCERRERRRRRALTTWIAARIRQWRRRRGHAAASRADWDLNVMLEHVWPQFLHQARLNVLVPNPEWFDGRDRAFLESIDRLWTKSAMAEQLFRAMGCATVHIGFDSEERYLPQVERRGWFLHLAGRSPLKGTRRLLALWKRHPEWPRLTVIENDAMPDKSEDVGSCGNIDYQRGYVSDEDLRRSQNAHRFHLCPSEAEGWGHYLAEAMSVGAVTLTTDAAPMNELITPERGLLVASRASGTHNLAQLARFEETALEQAVARCLSLEPGQLEALGAAARAWFATNKHSFHERIACATAEAAAAVRA